MSDQVNTTDNASPRYEGPQLSVAGSAESLVRGRGCSGLTPPTTSISPTASDGGEPPTDAGVPQPEVDLLVGSRSEPATDARYALARHAALLLTESGNGFILNMAD